MKIGSIEIKKAYYGIVPLTSSNAFIGTTPVVAQAVDDRLRFVADAASSFYLSKSRYQTVAQYSTDGTTWADIPTSSASAVQMASGDTVYIRGKLTNSQTESSGFYSNFIMNGKIQCRGNIMYWYNFEQPEQTTLSYTYTFLNLFKNCTSLTSAPELPATTLNNFCYTNMFTGCTSLTTAPELPATSFTASYGGSYQYCYWGMFQGCTSLTTAPELSATTPETACYGNMFNGCTNLKYIKCLATNISAFRCLENWTVGVGSTGTFIKSANMSSWPTGVNGIPSGWTVQDA